MSQKFVKERRNKQQKKQEHIDQINACLVTQKYDPTTKVPKGFCWGKNPCTTVVSQLVKQLFCQNKTQQDSATSLSTSCPGEPSVPEGVT